MSVNLGYITKFWCIVSNWVWYFSVLSLTTFYKWIAVYHQIAIVIFFEWRIIFSVCFRFSYSFSDFQINVTCIMYKIQFLSFISSKAKHVYSDRIEKCKFPIDVLDFVQWTHVEPFLMMISFACKWWEIVELCMLS